MRRLQVIRKRPRRAGRPRNSHLNQHKTELKQRQRQHELGRFSGHSTAISRICRHPSHATVFRTAYMRLKIAMVVTEQRGIVVVHYVGKPYCQQESAHNFPLHSFWPTQRHHAHTVLHNETTPNKLNTNAHGGDRTHTHTNARRCPLRHIQRASQHVAAGICQRHNFARR